MPEERKVQDTDLVFALDIGTRSIIGVAGRVVDERLEVLAIEKEEHGKRAMLDGQIEDIEQVARVARRVTDRMEAKLGCVLQRVCVAAAGRALRTEKGRYAMTLPQVSRIDSDLISHLESGAVSDAEEQLSKGEDSQRRFYLVGYTVSSYLLDRYPLTSLKDHNGQQLEAEVVATFLPSEVVESLYTVMGAAGLEVASLTLEPIAALNAVIPADLRLLNLVLADIGAGTSDIAVCRDGSVVGYTMATVAGDEVTEAIMRAFLVDFKTAEEIKRALGESEELIRCRNILGQEERVAVPEVVQAIQEPMEKLADAIAKQILSVNNTAPSAVFLAGGGSKLTGLREQVAEKLEMDEKRVAIAGNNFALSAFSDSLELERPEYATPLGIAISAGLGLLNDSYVVLLNGQSAKLFRNGVLTLRDILLMNGYSYADMVGKTGKSLTLTVDGKRMVLRGEPAVPAVLEVNGEEAALSAVIHAGDQIHFVPARGGEDAHRTLGELLGPGFYGTALVNNVQAPLDIRLSQGDVILTMRQAAPIPPAQAAPAPAPQFAPVRPAPPAVPAQGGRELHLFLNGEPLTLPIKDNDAPYYLMDLLEYSGIDFENLDRAVRLEVNGQERGFQHQLKEQDSVSIQLV